MFSKADTFVKDGQTDLIPRIDDSSTKIDVNMRNVADPVAKFEKLWNNRL
jgi:hypothetical protein